MSFSTVFNHWNMVDLLSQYLEWKDLMNVREVSKPFYEHGVLHMPKMLLIKLTRRYFADAQYDIRCPNSMIPRSIAYHCLITFDMPVFHIAEGHTHAISTLIAATHNEFKDIDIFHPRKSLLGRIYKKHCGDIKYKKIVSMPVDHYATSGSVNMHAYCYNLCNDTPMFAKLYEYLYDYQSLDPDEHFKIRLAKAHRFAAINEVFARYADNEGDDGMVNSFIKIAILNNNPFLLRWLHQNEHTAGADIWKRDDDIDLYTYIETHIDWDDETCEWSDITDILLDIYGLPEACEEWIRCTICVDKFIRAGYKFSDGELSKLASKAYADMGDRVYTLIESYQC